jgi:hypothetical protein
MRHARWIDEQQQSRSLGGGAVRARKQHDAVEIGQDAGDEGALALTERDIHPHHTHPLLELTPSHTQPEE